MLAEQPLSADEINQKLGKKVKEKFGNITIYYRPARIKELEDEGLIEFDKKLGKWKLKAKP